MVTRGGEASRVKGEANVGGVASVGSGGRKKARGFKLNGEAVEGETSEGSKLGADGVHGAFDLGVKGGFKMLGEVTAVEEVEAKGIDGAGAERAGGVTKV